MGLDRTDFDKIINEIYSGKATTIACKDSGIDFRKFYDSMAENLVLSEIYERACKARTDRQAEDILEIADTDADPQRARNRIDARKWIASKMNPGRYGDRLDVNLQGTVDILAAIDAGKQRAAIPRSYTENTIDAEVIRPKQLSLVTPTGSQPDTETQPIENQGDSKNDLPDPFS